MRTASTRDGESLTQFSARVANEWPVDLTAAINGLDPEEQVTAGNSYKIMRTEAYAR